MSCKFIGCQRDHVIEFTIHLHDTRLGKGNVPPVALPGNDELLTLGLAERDQRDQKLPQHGDVNYLWVFVNLRGGQIDFTHAQREHIPTLDLRPGSSVDMTRVSVCTTGHSNQIVYVKSLEYFSGNHAAVHGI